MEVFAPSGRRARARGSSRRDKIAGRQTDRQFHGKIRGRAFIGFNGMANRRAGNLRFFPFSFFFEARARVLSRAREGTQEILSNMAATRDPTDSIETICTAIRRYARVGWRRGL